MKVALEQAEKEVLSWLDFKKVSTESREEKKDNIAELAKAISNGDLILDSETFEFTHKLKFPIGAEVTISELKYAPRVNVKAVQKLMQGTKTDDLHGMILAYGAALSGQPKAVVSNIDTEDYRVLQKVAVFFM